MRKRRLLSAQLTGAEEFNGLSLENQRFFVGMVVVSADGGVVPAAAYTFCVLVSSPEVCCALLGEKVREIVSTGPGKLIDQEGKLLFVFNRRSFDERSECEPETGG